jgi:hypothetical protein
MQLRRPDRPERPLEENFAMVAEGGYHGMAIDLGAMDIDAALKAEPFFDKYSLGCLITAFPKTINDLTPAIEMAKRFRARFVNVVGQVMPLKVEEMIPVIRRWMEMGEQARIGVQFETHRNSITNDLFSTLQLLDAIPEMVVCADLSHYLLDREFSFPVTAENHNLIRRVLERAGSFQGRVGSREQIQVQISFPQHRKWFDLFSGWWQEGFRYWRNNAQSDACLNFLCELGPKEYAMTDREGYELSDRWEEALIIRERVLEIWAQLEKEDASIPP